MITRQEAIVIETNKLIDLLTGKTIDDLERIFDSPEDNPTKLQYDLVVAYRTMTDDDWSLNGYNSRMSSDVDHDVDVIHRAEAAELIKLRNAARDDVKLLYAPDGDRHMIIVAAGGDEPDFIAYHRVAFEVVKLLRASGNLLDIC
jgi:hypothetical protein